MSPPSRAFRCRLGPPRPRFSRWRSSMRRVERLSFRFLVVGCCFAAMAWHLNGQTGTTGMTVFEGARLITGDGGAPIENSAFIVENTSSPGWPAGRSADAGRRGACGSGRQDRHADQGRYPRPHRVPARSTTGRWPRSTSRARTSSTISSGSRTTGSAASSSIADLVDRSDLRGGRTQVGRRAAAACGTRSFPAPRSFAPPAPGLPGRNPAPRAIRPEPTCRIR